jgi:hypothetical protein
VIIQDKRLDNFGTPEYSEPGSGGFVGDTLLVNGAQSPYVEVSRGWVRLRLLNAPTRALSAADERWPSAARDFGRSGLFTGAGVRQTAGAGAGRAS